MSLHLLEEIYKQWLEPYKDWSRPGDEVPSFHRLYQDNERAYRIDAFHNLEIVKHPSEWELRFYHPKDIDHVAQTYKTVEEARVVAMRWLFQGIWEPI